MIQVRFKNLEESELAKEAAIENVGCLAERFPELEESRITVTLRMAASSSLTGPDIFTVKIHIQNGRHRGLVVEQSAPSLYTSLDEAVHLMDRMLSDARAPREERA